MSRHELTAGTVALAIFGLVACGDDDGLKADAGGDFSVVVGESPEFDGCSSSGNIVNYEWVIIEAPGTMADDVGKPLPETLNECAFTLETAMIVDEIGMWVIELTVTDTDGATSTDSVSVDITD